MQKIPAADRRRRAEEAGEEVEALVKADPPLIQGNILDSICYC